MASHRTWNRAVQATEASKAALGDRLRVTTSPLPIGDQNKRNLDWVNYLESLNGDLSRPLELPEWFAALVGRWHAFRMGGAVKTYRATARRDDNWWVVDVDGVGTTQGHSTAEAQRMAADLVAIMKDIPLDQVRVQIEFELAGDLVS